MKIILASKSPRRKELLGKIVKDFTVAESNADETVNEELPPDILISEISERKAEAVEKIYGKDCVIIAADTAVFSDGTRFGKPKSKEEAVLMLKKFSGNRHSVITAFTVCYGGKKITEAVETFVFFRELTDSEIEKYADTDEPYDKAGGYGIQGAAAKFIEKIEGDYYNVMGLPVCKLTLALRKLGLGV